MAYVRTHETVEPPQADVQRWPGTVVLEFGTDWCGHCLGAQPAIASALAPRDDVRHVKIEDGKGRPLGRAYRVKLWPTLVVLRDGEELARVVRPTRSEEIASILPPGA